MAAPTNPDAPDCKHENTVSYPAGWPEIHRVRIFCADCDIFLREEHE